MDISINATIETRKFKNGEFKVLVLHLSKHTEKIVFLTSAEMEIVNNNYSTSPSYTMPDLG